MKDIDRTRITLSIDTDIFERFNKLTKEVGVSKDQLLSSTLKSELNYLSKLPANGPKASRWYAAIDKVKSNKKRMNLTLKKDTADYLNELCKEKGIHRDQFISEYIMFLIDGDPEENCPSPLEKAADLLADPRTEYYSFENINPYDDLHMTEEQTTNVEEFALELKDMKFNQ